MQKLWGKINAKNWKNLIKYLNMIEFFESKFNMKLIQFLYSILEMKEQVDRVVGLDWKVRLVCQFEKIIEERVTE